MTVILYKSVLVGPLQACVIQRMAEDRLAIFKKSIGFYVSVSDV